MGEPKIEIENTLLPCRMMRRNLELKTPLLPILLVLHGKELVA